jgi:hypothetical protein
VRHDLSVFTTDGDFPRFARCLPIVLHEVRRSAEATSARCRRSAPEGRRGVGGACRPRRGRCLKESRGHS